MQHVDNAIFRQYSIALLIHFVMLVVRVQIWSRAVINVWFVQGRNMNMVKVVDVAERQVDHKATVIIEEIGHSGTRFQPQYSEAEADTRVWVPWRPELHSETLSQEKVGAGGRDLAFYTGTIEITSREENSIYSKFILKGKSLAGGGGGEPWESRASRARCLLGEFTRLSSEAHKGCSRWDLRCQAACWEGRAWRLPRGAEFASM